MNETFEAIIALIIVLLGIAGSIWFTVIIIQACLKIING